MSHEQENQESEKTIDEPATAQENVAGEGEFKLTVRKLEMPVRPRGVLAE
jgi:hypothetical protein